MTQDAKSAANSHREAPVTIQHRKFLFVSDLGSIGDLAFAVKNEGNEVKYNIRSKTEKEISDGFLEKTEDWESVKNWADVIIFDAALNGLSFHTIRFRITPEVCRA